MQITIYILLAGTRHVLIIFKETKINMTETRVEAQWVYTKDRLGYLCEPILVVAWDAFAKAGEKSFDTGKALRTERFYVISPTAKKEDIAHLKKRIAQYLNNEIGDMRLVQEALEQCRSIRGAYEN